MSAIPLSVQAQAGGEDPIGFGEIKLGAPIASLTLTCLEPVMCEETYDSVWVRIRHTDGLVGAVDVIYSGRKTKTGEPIESSPITLPQAIRMHSIRNGRQAPRLVFGGSHNGDRVIVDVANGIAYLADGALESSLVKEVHYVPATDPLLRSASISPLSDHGAWLMKAARATRIYTNTLADPEIGARAATQISPQEIAARLQKTSVEVGEFAQATLMLSRRVSESLEKHQQPDPGVASNLRKAFALLTTTTDEALELIRNHPDMETPEAAKALPLDLAAAAGARMKQLAEEGFAE